ncbi:MAG: hypothetical protein PWP23_809 [Candidatus Sumerlaeota bacterium]|nr:hypothetical protein [Candidatus Sumerlaeota bacterium]
MLPGILHSGCEPIPVLFFLWSGPANGAGFLAGSLAVFVLVIAAKCAIFGRLGPEGFGVNAWRMLLANIVSTVAGLFVGGSFASSAFSLLMLLALIVLAFPAGRILTQGLAGTKWEKTSGAKLAGILLVLAIFSSVAFTVFLISIHPDLHIVLYWTVKVATLFCGLGTSIVLTSILEALVIARISPVNDHGEILRAAVAANLWTFFGVFLIGAIIAFPVRMKRPRDFLMPRSW